ncbi:fumarylacetoacetase [Polaromonas sp. CF318]|uniref:fumarylacetoacetase n=1 Tax=Polaromonas sp. CF318 TaxID=1144318 RepID=UPI000270E2AF|nr:fumarylacetoacetase [Polaromonas sp. CF318]EJL87092.1 fumarylacetoacetase [Polaromonas sp. CF318]
MTTLLNATHDPQLRSWVGSANEASDFPIQNLPFGTYSLTPQGERKIGVAIGDQVLDLRATGLTDAGDMNTLMAQSPQAMGALRAAISQGLAEGSARQGEWAGLLHRQDAVTLHLPCRIGDYTDFYTGIHHATTVGKLFRPDAPLLPNYKWVPIGYHGRASSIGVSGQQFPRPRGQTKGPNEELPLLRPSHRLDYELELGVFVGQGNALGEPVAMEEAEAHAFGLVLLNDWSARDVQAWEYQPLGPFLSKNFASTISPWIVTLEALAPFRAAFTRPEGDPQPLPYLDSPGNRQQGSLDVQLEVWLQTQAMRDAGLGPECLSQSNYRDAYWTVAQMLAHHTVNGCNLQPGDLLGTGTLSGPRPEQAGSLLELTSGGKNALTLANGETRTFLQDGDAIILRAWCEREGFTRIGFGECRGQVLPAR